MTNEDVIREIAAKYEPEEIISAALVAMCMLLPLPHELVFELGLSRLKMVLEKNPSRFFATTNTEP